MRVRFASKHVPEGDYLLRFDPYVMDGSLCIRVSSMRGEHMLTATACLHGIHPVPPGPDEVYIKTHSENEGVFEGLISAVVITDTGRSVVIDFGPYKNEYKVGLLTDLAKQQVELQDDR